MSNQIWTLFYDSHSGGYQKEDYNTIIIEAPMDEAKIIFYNRFKHNPLRITCICCGSDYNIYEEDEEEIESYKNREDVLLIYKEEIKDDERVGEIPLQGYIWI